MPTKKHRKGHAGVTIPGVFARKGDGQDACRNLVLGADLAEHAFLRLGDVLADIARDSVESCARELPTQEVSHGEP